MQQRGLQKKKKLVTFGAIDEKVDFVYSLEKLHCRPINGERRFCQNFGNYVRFKKKMKILEIVRLSEIATKVLNDHIWFDGKRLNS